MFESSSTDAFPSFPGGPAAKIGDLYERAWTVRSMLDLLSGDVVELRLEEPGSDGLGVEFCRILPTGEREYHSVKRQAPHSSGHWSVAAITRESKNTARSILGDLFRLTRKREDARAVFVSQSGVEKLQSLVDQAISSANVDEFLGRLSNDLRKEFETRIVPLCETREVARFDLMKCEFRTMDHRSLLGVVEQRISALVQRADGAEVDREVVRTLLEGFAWSRLGQTMTALDVTQKFN